MSWGRSCWSCSGWRCAPEVSGPWPGRPRGRGAQPGARRLLPRGNFGGARGDLAAGSPVRALAGVGGFVQARHSWGKGSRVGGSVCEARVAGGPSPRGNLPLRSHLPWVGLGLLQGGCGSRERLERSGQGLRKTLPQGTMGASPRTVGRAQKDPCVKAPGEGA